MIKKGYAEKIKGKTYIYEKALGAGSYGTTWIATSNDEKVAIKVFKLKGNDTIESLFEDWEIEIKALQKILPECYPWAVCLKDTIFEGSSAKIIMEYIRGEPLFRYMLNTPLKKRQKDHKMLNNLIQGIQVLHKFDIVHQDIKGENIMYDYENDLFRFIDFGLSCIKSNNLKPWPCGTIGTRYAVPPELTKKSKQINWEILQAHDYWSIGIMLLRWYTFNFDPHYYSKEIMKTVKPRNKAVKMQNDSIAKNTYFPHYYNFSETFLYNEICKIPNNAVMVITALLLTINSNERFQNFKIVKNILDSTINFEINGLDKLRN